MKDRLRELLFEYLTRQAPELIIKKKGRDSLESLLSASVARVGVIARRLLRKGIPEPKVEAICYELIIRRFKPSRFHYISALLEQEHLQAYTRWREKGTLTYQVSTIIDLCEPVFAYYKFSPASAHDQQLRKVITDIIGCYVRKIERS